MISIFEGSILDAPVDVIVNPANSFLRHGGGLAKVIDQAAQGNGLGTAGDEVLQTDWPERGDERMQVLKKELNPARNAYQTWGLQQGLIPAGGAVLGPPGALCRRFKGIIHAVGPIWGGGDFYESDLLGMAYENALSIALENNWSIAFPAISAGIFGVPIEKVAEEAIGGICVTVPNVAASQNVHVTFALMDPAHVEAFKVEGERWGLDL